MAVLVCGLILSNAFAGLIAAGILKGMQGVGHLAAWRWLFILEALATIFVAVCAILLLADYPGNTKWLSEAERMVAEARLAIDVGSEQILDEERISVWESIVMAARDYRVWLFACMQMATTASISYSHFFPTLIQELGFHDSTETLLLTSPPYVLALIWALSCAWIADRKQIRSSLAIMSMSIALVGVVITVSLPDVQRWPRYAMTFLITSGTYGVYSTTYTWLSSTIPAPPEKRAVAIGLANSLANLASFYGNYFWLDEYEPQYTVSWICIIAFMALALGAMIALRVVLTKANSRLEALACQATNDQGALSQDELRAVRQGFRYLI